MYVGGCALQGQGSTLADGGALTLTLTLTLIQTLTLALTLTMTRP